MWFKLTLRGRFYKEKTMIIKSMSRKDKSFGQLVTYMSDIAKSDEQYNIYHNIYSRKIADIEQEFLQNAEYVPKRKNGVYMYHEILSISKAKHLSDSKQKAILREIAYQYAKQRAGNNLIFATLHDDHEHHLHYHFLISSNAVGESKKTRLSKVQFDRFKKHLESRTLEHFPELEQKVIINKQAGEKLSRRGGERKRRTGKTPQRDIVKQKLETIFANSETKQGFFEAMSKAGFEIYVRGKTIGILDTAHNRKHRLKTLGLLSAFEVMSARIELDEAAKQTTKKQRKRKSSQQEDKKPDSPATQTQQNQTQQNQTQQNQTQQKGSQTETKQSHPKTSQSGDGESETIKSQAQPESTAQETTDKLNNQTQQHQAEIEKIRKQKAKAQMQAEKNRREQSQEQQKK